MNSVFAANLLTPNGWKSDQLIIIDGLGKITNICNADKNESDYHAEIIIPGFINLHSHSFQWSMAGLAENFGKIGDSFWSWRELMYRFVQNIQPEDLAIIAEALYIDMLKAGYTEVGEFHYLHKQTCGTSYSQLELLSVEVIEAARSAGIIICHLPVLYQQAGFGKQPLTQLQQRFYLDTDEYFRLNQQLNSKYCEDPLVTLGIAPHSLRAVDLRQLAELTENISIETPIHIHIAEQKAEVEQALKAHGATPINCLYEHIDVTKNWCLIHATHISAEEITKVADSGASVGLCPTTEANLGDGIFPLMNFKNQSGQWGIGSDSHVSIDPREELRLLEYGQRLSTHSRANYSSQKNPQTATNLIQDCGTGGSKALQSRAGKIKVGALANLVCLDVPSQFQDFSAEQLISKWIFSSRGNWIKDVMVAGKWVVQDGRHPHQHSSNQKLKQVLKKINN